MKTAHKPSPLQEARGVNLVHGRALGVGLHRLKTVQDVNEYPLLNPSLASLPQIAIIGRINTGKSSLINHVLRRNNLAKASSRANKTTAVDLLTVGNAPVLTKEEAQVRVSAP